MCAAANTNLTRETVGVFLAHPRAFVYLDDQDSGDARGVVSFICPDLTRPLLTNGYDVISLWSVEVDPRYGQYEQCNGHATPPSLETLRKREPRAREVTSARTPPRVRVPVQVTRGCALGSRTFTSGGRSGMADRVAPGSAPRTPRWAHGSATLLAASARRLPRSSVTTARGALPAQHSGRGSVAALVCFDPHRAKRRARTRDSSQTTTTRESRLLKGPHLIELPGGFTKRSPVCARLQAAACARQDDRALVSVHNAAYDGSVLGGREWWCRAFRRHLAIQPLARGFRSRLRHRRSRARRVPEPLGKICLYSRSLAVFEATFATDQSYGGARTFPHGVIAPPSHSHRGSGPDLRPKCIYQTPRHLTVLHRRRRPNHVPNPRKIGKFREVPASVIPSGSQLILTIKFGTFSRNPILLSLGFQV